MDGVLETTVAALLKEGILGVIIVGLAIWCWKLQTQLNAIQEKRVQDALKIADAAHTFASALDRNTDTLRAFSED